MESRHIKLDYSEAIFTRKQLLNSELDFLNLVKILRNYRNLRKKEMELKRQLKSKFYNLKKDFLLLKESIPNNVPEIKHKPRISENISNKQILDKNEDIQSQLSEIKQKLEKLQ